MLHALHILVHLIFEREKEKEWTIIIIFIGSASEVPPDYTCTTLYCNIISYFPKECKEILVDTEGAGLMLVREGKADVLLLKPHLP